jgi:hypothetical protein
VVIPPLSSLASDLRPLASGRVRPPLRIRWGEGRGEVALSSDLHFTCAFLPEISHWLTVGNGSLSKMKVSPRMRTNRHELAQKTVARCFRCKKAEPARTPRPRPRRRAAGESSAGTIENSPAIHRWGLEQAVPKSRRDERTPAGRGRQEGTSSVVPAGLAPTRASRPSDESLGYSLSPSGLTRIPLMPPWRAMAPAKT